MNRPGAINYQRIPKRNIMVARPAKPKAPTNKALNKKIKNIQNNLIELKRKDVFNNNTVIPNTGLLINGMNFTSGGTAPRSGFTINATSLTMKAVVTSDVDILSASVIRCIIFWDRQPNGADAILAGDNGVLDNGIVTNLIVTPRNLQTIDRYKILEDFTFVLNPSVVLDFDTVTGTTTTVITKSETINRYVKLSRQMVYDGTAGTIADSVTNSINVFFISDQAANQPTLLSGVRLYYKD